MDASLGSRTKENGYKDAPVIVKGRLIEGVGGGVLPGYVNIVCCSTQGKA